MVIIRSQKYRSNQDNFYAFMEMNILSQEAKYDRLSACKHAVTVSLIWMLVSVDVNQCVERVSFLMAIYRLALELSAWLTASHSMNQNNC